MEIDLTLANFFGADTIDFKLIDPSQYAHMIIDVQKDFCDSSIRGNKFTESIAQKIAKQKPILEEFGIQSMIVYTDGVGRGLNQAYGGLYRIPLNTGHDLLSPKSQESAFLTGNAEAILKTAGIKNLIVSGFNANSCVLETVKDGLSYGFNFMLLEDLIGVGKSAHDPIECTRFYLEHMQELGAETATSEVLIDFLTDATQHPS